MLSHVGGSVKIQRPIPYTTSVSLSLCSSLAFWVILILYWLSVYLIGEGRIPTFYGLSVSKILIVPIVVTLRGGLFWEVMKALIEVFRENSPLLIFCHVRAEHFSPFIALSIPFVI